MPKIGTHEVPARTLLLVGVDGVAIMLALLAASAVRTGIRFSEMILQLSLWTKITLITIICGLSLYFNDLYDFQVVRSRDNLFVHTMQAIGTACFLLDMLFYYTSATNLSYGISTLDGPMYLDFMRMLPI